MVSWRISLHRSMRHWNAKLSSNWISLTEVFKTPSAGWVSTGCRQHLIWFRSLEHYPELKFFCYEFWNCVANWTRHSWTIFRMFDSFGKVFVFSSFFPAHLENLDIKWKVFLVLWFSEETRKLIKFPFTILLLHCADFFSRSVAVLFGSIPTFFSKNTVE